MYKTKKIGIVLYSISAVLILFIIALSPLIYQAQSLENDLESGIKAITDDLQKSFIQPTKIAILPFSWNNYSQWALCRIVTELIYTNISKPNGIDIIDKLTLIKTIANLKIDIEKGIIAPQDILRLKEALGCNIIITGHITDQNTLININVFSWQAETSNLIMKKSFQIRKTSDIIALIDSPNKSDLTQKEYCSVKWQSPILPYRILSLSDSDIDGDGINELILVTDSELKVLVWDGFGFIDKASIKYNDNIPLKRNQKDIRFLFCIDSNSDGKDEVYLSVPDLETSIWKLEKDSFTKTGTMPFMLISYQTDKMVSSLLKNNRNYFSGQKTYEISLADNSRIEKAIPSDYYSIAIAQTSDIEGQEWVIVDTENIMKIYSDNMNLNWESKTMFGKGIIIADLDNNKRNEIIGTSSLPEGERDFLFILEWNGNTYEKKWESQNIVGTISALNFGDPNNDGIEELIVVVNAKDGSEIYLYTANYLQ